MTRSDKVEYMYNMESERVCSKRVNSRTLRDDNDIDDTADSNRQINNNKHVKFIAQKMFVTYFKKRTAENKMKCVRESESEND